jgi:hypothetical protein
MTTKNTKQTAYKHCLKRRQEIARVMDWIELELDKHTTEAKAEPWNFGYAGSLCHVLEKMVTTLAFLSNSEPEDIEKLLGE